jgi:ribose transport system permease protein
VFARGFGLERFSGLYLWATFIIVFGIWNPSLFLTKTTLYSVASQQAIVGMLALAVLVPLAAGAYDLSVGANINISTVLAASLQATYHWGMWASIAIPIAVGTAIGALNGLIIVRLKVNSFIATLGTTSVITAIQTMIAPTQPNPPDSTAWLQLGGRDVFGFQIVVLYLLVLALIVWWVTEHTPVGRYLYAVGGNHEAARLAGVRVDALVWSSMITSGLIAGIAGVFYASTTGPSLTFGSSLLLPAFAAVFLGSTQLKPGRFNVWGTLIAIYTLATGVRGLVFVTSQQWINDMFNGVALVGAVAFAVWRQTRPPGRRRPEEPDHDAVAQSILDLGLARGEMRRSVNALVELNSHS